MGEYRGVLQKIELDTIKKGNNAGQEFRKITVNKATFSVFDNKLHKTLNELKDQEVVVEYKERENSQNPQRPFWDFVSIRLASEAEKNSGSSGGRNGGYRGKSAQELSLDAYRNRSIEAQKALSEAVAANIGLKMEGVDISDEQVLDTARKFLAFIDEAHGSKPHVEVKHSEESPGPEEKGKGTGGVKVIDKEAIAKFNKRRDELQFIDADVKEALGGKNIGQYINSGGTFEDAVELMERRAGIPVD